MRFIAFILLLLFACTPEVQPILAPTTAVVLNPCNTFTVGEGCVKDCDCLKPAVCLQGICSLTKLEDGESCVHNSQCLSSYCTESDYCGGPVTTSYECTREFTDDYTGNQRQHYTVCRR